LGLRDFEGLEFVKTLTKILSCAYGFLAIAGGGFLIFRATRDDLLKLPGIEHGMSYEIISGDRVYWSCIGLGLVFVILGVVYIWQELKNSSEGNK